MRRFAWIVLAFPVIELIGLVLLAGVLLIFPGVISDLIALILLLPLRGPQLGAGQSAPGEGPRAANDSVIEGEFSRVDDPKKRLPGQD